MNQPLFVNNTACGSLRKKPRPTRIEEFSTIQTIGPYHGALVWTSNLTYIPVIYSTMHKTGAHKQTPPGSDRGPQQLLIGKPSQLRALPLADDTNSAWPYICRNLRNNGSAVYVGACRIYINRNKPRSVQGAAVDMPNPYE